MKLSSRKSSHQRMIALDMTPMIDVVFLLLIFFLITTSFVQTERELDPATRVEESNAAASAADFEPAIVDVTSGAGGFVYRLGGRDFVDPKELTSTLSLFPDKSNGAFVRVSDSAPFGMGATAIQAARDAGFAVVSYIPTGGAP